ncbi:MAG: carbonic anhydrase [Methylocystis sp.]
MIDQERQTPLLSATLLDGYESFLSGRFQREQQKFRELAERGQRPHTLVIGCCDSRVTPEEIFDAKPGEIFDARNIANLVPPHGSDSYSHGSWAAIDYAVSILQVSQIVVLGHARCGGVRAFLDHYAEKAAPAKEDYIGNWISILAQAAGRIAPPPAVFDESYADRLARESIKQGLTNLRSFEKVVAAEKAGTLALHGAFFSIEDASLFALDESNGEFVQVLSSRHRAALARSRF